MLYELNSKAEIIKTNNTETLNVHREIRAVGNTENVNAHKQLIFTFVYAK